MHTANLEPRHSGSANDQIEMGLNEDKHLGQKVCVLWGETMKLHQIPLERLGSHKCMPAFLAVVVFPDFL